MTGDEPDRYPRLEVVLSVAMTAFFAYTAIAGEFSTFVQRSAPLGLATLLIALKCPTRLGASRVGRALGRAADAALAACALSSITYLMIEQDAIVQRIGSETTADITMAGIGTLSVIEIARRTTGKWLPIVAIALMMYAAWGNLVPGRLAHRGFTIDRILRYTWLSTEGVFGLALGVMASIIFYYLLFAVLLELTGAGYFFIQLAYAVTGRFRSGPALCAVVASSMFGTVSGSAIANVAAVGTFTIPLMKRRGYSSDMAAAIESASSIGGQIMPPIMGASAFIMAEVTGTPYGRIAAMAAIPACLYYLGLVISVHVEACRLGLRPAGLDERVRMRVLLRAGFPFLLPLCLLIVVLMFGYSPVEAAVYAIGSLLAVNLIVGKPRLGWRSGLEVVVRAARMSLLLWAAVSSIGIIIAVATMTGVGGKLSELVTMAPGRTLLVALVITMLASLVLGTALPTVPTYILLAIIVGPSLTGFGVPIVVAHFFLFYFGIIADLTPPVALAPYAAAGLASADPNRTMWLACRVAFAGYIVPFLFVFQPALLLLGSPAEILTASVVAVFAVGLLGIGAGGQFFGPLSAVERILVAAAAAVLVSPARTVQLAAMAFSLALLTRRVVASMRTRRCGVTVDAEAERSS